MSIKVISVSDKGRKAQIVVITPAGSFTKHVKREGNEWVWRKNKQELRYPAD